MAVSRTQIRNLGSRLRDGAQCDGDEELLQEWIRRHDEPMREVSRAIGVELGLQNTPRLKTRKTLIEKLVREKTNLLNMDDVAGVRLDAHACGIRTLLDQDRAVSLIADRFPDNKIKYRRDNPNHGYRAVHVIVRHGDCLIEVQVRTEFQHQWAEITEKLADQVGRGLRYGVPPADKKARELHSLLLQMSIHLAGYEQHAAFYQRSGGDDLRGNPDVDRLAVLLASLRESLSDLLAETRVAVANFQRR